VPFYIPSRSVWEFPLLYRLPSTHYCLSFLFQSSWRWDVLCLFMCLSGILHLFWKCVQIPCHSGYNFIMRYIINKDFFPFCELLFHFLMAWLLQHY
jgi:hypothetical protein